MRLFDHGEPLRFGLIVERMNDVGIRLRTDLGSITGPGVHRQLWFLERRTMDDLPILVSIPAYELEDMIPRSEQHLWAQRLNMTHNETQRVFGWARL